MLWESIVHRNILYIFSIRADVGSHSCIFSLNLPVIFLVGKQEPCAACVDFPLDGCRSLGFALGRLPTERNSSPSGRCEARASLPQGQLPIYGAVWKRLHPYEIKADGDSALHSPATGRMGRKIGPRDFKLLSAGTIQSAARQPEAYDSEPVADSGRSHSTRNLILKPLVWLVCLRWLGVLVYQGLTGHWGPIPWSASRTARGRRR